MLGRSLCLTALILASEVAWAISDDDYITGARGEGYGSSGGLLGLWWILAILIWVLYEKWKKHKNSKEPTWEDKMVEYRKLAAQREAEEKEFYGDHKKGEK